jgi:hypothetical protein
MKEIDEHEETWKPFTITTTGPALGEQRQQVWMGRTAEHALERCAAEPNGLMVPVPVSVTAEWYDVLEARALRDERDEQIADILFSKRKG